MYNNYKTNNILIGNINIRGLYKKSEKIMGLMDTYQLTILVLQETHLNKGKLTQIKEKMDKNGFNFLGTEDQPNAGGVGIVLRKRDILNCNTILIDNKNHILKVTIKLKNSISFSITNVYAPQRMNNQQLKWISELESVCNNFQGENNFIMGDFNNDVDNKSENEEIKIKSMMEASDLQDIWFNFNSKTSATWYSPLIALKPPPRLGARLRQMNYDEPDASEVTYKVQLFDGTYINLNTEQATDFKRNMMQSVDELDENEIDFIMYYWMESNRNSARLDRIYADSSALLLVKDLKVVPVNNQDHNMLILELLSSKSCYQPELWRLKNITLEDNYTKNKIQQVLDSTWSRVQLENNTTKVELVDTMLTQLGDFLKQRQKQLLRINEQMLQFHKKLTADANVPIEVRNRSAFVVHNIMEKKIREKREKTRLSIDLNMENPSKALTSFLKSKAAENFMPYLMGSNNQKLEKIEDILKEAEFFYSDLYSEKEINEDSLEELLKFWNKPNISSLSSLVDPFTEEEIEECIKSMANKAPGEDGLTATFFKTFIESWTKLLCSVFNCFLDGTTIPKRWTRAIIITLKKSSGEATSLNHRRPISLLNVIWKLFTKSITIRLAKVIGDLVHHDQKGFIGHRSIFENIHDLKEIIKINKNKRDIRNAFALLLDMEKAYDRVSPKALIKILQHIGLPNKLIDLISAITSNNKAKVYINNKLSSEFSINSGVKQGDPLSPLLFNLVMELLANAIRNNPNIQGLQISKRRPNAKKKINLFADDCVIFGYGKPDYDAIEKTIKLFESATASKINVSKSKVIKIKSSVDFNIRYQDVDETNGERYLGFQFNNNGIVSNMKNRINEVIDLLFKWKRFHFTLIGRVNIVKTYAVSKLLYFMRFDRPTQNQIKKLQKVINWFIWYNSKSFDRTIKYKSKMNNLRASNLNKYGGLQFPDFGTLVEIYKAEPALLILQNVKSSFVENSIFDLEKINYNMENPKKIPKIKNNKFLKDSIIALNKIRRSEHRFLFFFFVRKCFFNFVTADPGNTIRLPNYLVQP